MASKGQSQRSNLIRSRTAWVLLGFLAIAGFFLVTEHKAHLFGVLPFVLLLLCPLLHLFMHRGHGGHGGQGEPGAHGGHSRGHAGHDGGHQDRRPEEGEKL